MSYAASLSSRWMSPPEPIAQTLDASKPPTVAFSPDYQWILQLDRPDLPSISELATPVLGLAGLRLNPDIHGPARASGYHGLRLLPVSDLSKCHEVALPEPAKIRDLRWSPDGRRLAFAQLEPDGLSLWVMDLADRVPRKLTGPVINAVHGSAFQWLPGDEGLLVKIVPPDQGPRPKPPEVPQGPLVEENLGRKTPARTYTNLLKSPADAALFAHLLMSEVHHVSLDGSSQRVLSPDLVINCLPSPDGQFLLVSTLKRPFGYTVPVSRFARRIALLDRQGVELQVVADLPLADDVSVTFDSVRTGRRRVHWRPDRPASLAFVEALDEGDAQQSVSHRDRLCGWVAPFTEDPVEIWRSELRFTGVQWGDGDTALVREHWWNSRAYRMWRIAPAHLDREPTLLMTRNFQDHYADPGAPMMRRGPYGRGVLRLSPDGSSIFMNGRGVSPKGVYPFLDRMNLLTGDTERLWQAQGQRLESVAYILDEEADEFILRRQSPSEPPNIYLYRRSTGEEIGLVKHADWAPAFAGIQRQVLRYKREDGLPLSAILYLPVGYEAERDGPLPTILWSYPDEHKSRDTAGQVTASDHTFVRPGGTSILFLLSQGYAVLNRPAMPIVGEEGEEPNDSYLQQLESNARAAIDCVVELGVSDRARMAIGGHSYGAFTTANLLAHTDLFRAGIARNGAYNRSLTPFGFQGEQRTYWEAPDVYHRMSPLTWAHQITAPLLLIHGAEDANTGTYPMQSRRLFEALKGLGAVVRWVEIPLEEHSYRSREAVGQVLWEMVTWLDLHLK